MDEFDQQTERIAAFFENVPVLLVSVDAQDTENRLTFMQGQLMSKLDLSGSVGQGISAVFRRFPKIYDVLVKALRGEQSSGERPVQVNNLQLRIITKELHDSKNLRSSVIAIIIDSTQEVTYNDLLRSISKDVNELRGLLKPAEPAGVRPLTLLDSIARQLPTFTEP